MSKTNRNSVAECYNPVVREQMEKQANGEERRLRSLNYLREWWSKRSYYKPKSSRSMKWYKKLTHKQERLEARKEIRDA